MAATEYFTTLIGGDMAEAVIKVFTDLIGDWFWVWFIGLGLMMLYGKTRDYATVGVIALVIFVHVMPVMPPSVHMMAYVLLAIAVANIIYRVYN